MTDRKILPLALMRANDEEPVEGRTRLQKMIFLTQKQLEDPDCFNEGYDYFPYDYGPFSKELYEDIDNLVEEGVIEEREETEEDGKKKYYYELTSEGKDTLEEKLQEEGSDSILDKIDEIKSQYNKMDLSELLDKIYAKYPDFAEESVL